MNRLLLPSLAGLVALLSATGSFAQAPNVTLYGRLTGFGVDVDNTRTTQSFHAHAARNFGAQGAGQWFTLGTYTRPGSELEASISKFTNNFRQVDPTEQPQYTSIIDITHTQPISLGGIATSGDRMFVAANERRMDGTWEARVYSFDIGSTSGSPPSLTTTLNLTKPGEAEGVSDLRLSNSIRYDTPTIAGFAAAERRVSNECYAPVLKKFEYRRNQESLTLRYGVEFAKDFPQCHLGGSTNVREAPPWFLDSTAPVPQPPASNSALVREAQPRGGTPRAYDRLHIGVRCSDNSQPGMPAPPEQACMYAVLDNGTTASLDTAFGGDGQVIIKAADGVTPLRYWDHAVDSQGKVLVSYGLGLSPGSFLPAVLRLNANGTLDTTFASGGVLTIPTTGINTNPRTMTIDINDNIQVSGETYTATTVRPFIFFLSKTSLPGAPETYASQIVEYAFAGHENSAFFTHVREPDGTIVATGTSYGNYPDPLSMRPLMVKVEGPPAAQPAIEYFHAGFGHFATIVNPVEINKLDTGVIAGWNRTGWWFNVYPVGTPGTIGIDRFFSDAFDPKSSHFYAANAVESAIVKQNPDWTFEGTVFGALVPSANGECSPSARRVSRAYNNGKTGAPNHRFGDDPGVIAQALASGGVLEGTVFCTE